MDKEIFINMLKSFGLKIDETQMDQLFSYVQKILPQLKKIEELDLNALEPFMPFKFEDL